MKSPGRLCDFLASDTESSFSRPMNLSHNARLNSLDGPGLPSSHHELFSSTSSLLLALPSSLDRDLALLEILQIALDVVNDVTTEDHRLLSTAFHHRDLAPSRQ
jgi:hypothetical protein